MMNMKLLSVVTPPSIYHHIKRLLYTNSNTEMTQKNYFHHMELKNNLSNGQFESLTLRSVHRE